MATYKFEMSVRSYSTIEFEVELDDDIQKIIEFYTQHAKEPIYNDLVKLLPDDIQHDISVAAIKAKATGFEHHEIAGNFSFEVEKIS